MQISSNSVLLKHIKHSSKGRTRKWRGNNQLNYLKPKNAFFCFFFFLWMINLLNYLNYYALDDLLLFDDL